MTSLVAHIAILNALAGNVQDSCRVRVEPAGASTDWVSAASALERTLRSSNSGDRDCREVVVHAAAANASVEVTTSDGRRGIRQLADARELETTVTALIETVPPAILAAPATLDSPAPSDVDQGVSWGWLLVAGGGGRITLPSVPSPVVDLMLGARSPRWELALYGSWTPTVVGTGGATRAGFSSSAEVGLSAGHRQPIGSVDLVGGLRATGIALRGHVVQDGDGMDVGEPMTAFAPALSAFIGTSIPLLSTVRLRPQASFQWIPIGLFGTDPKTSIWSFGVGLGAESGTL